VSKPSKKLDELKTHLNDLLVGHAREEDVVVVRVELDAIRDLAVRERLLASACNNQTRQLSEPSARKQFRRTRLGIPKLHLSIEGCTEELSTIVVESDVVNGLRVAHERAKTLALVVDVPQLAIRVRLASVPLVPLLQKASDAPLSSCPYFR
jgi:hypothetical protein